MALTDPEQGSPAETVVLRAPDVAPPPQQPRYGHVANVLRWLFEHGPVEHAPVRVRTDVLYHLVELNFDGPEAVLAWAKALRFSGPSNRRSEELRQVIVESDGVVTNWRVELRYVLTAQAGWSLPPVEAMGLRG